MEEKRQKKKYRALSRTQDTAYTNNEKTAYRQHQKQDICKTRYLVVLLHMDIVYVPGSCVHAAYHIPGKAAV